QRARIGQEKELGMRDNLRRLALADHLHPVRRPEPRVKPQRFKAPDGSHDGDGGRDCGSGADHDEILRSSKVQAPKLNQIQRIEKCKFQTRSARVCVLELGSWYLFVLCCLVLGAFVQFFPAPSVGLTLLATARAT